MGERAELWAVLIGIGIALIVGAIYWYRDKCPKCDRRSWKKELRAKKIDGSERKVTVYDPNQGSRTETRARFRVLYGCRHCGYRFRRTEERTISSSGGGQYYGGPSDSVSRQSAPTSGHKGGGEQIGRKY
jgi:hypothetical protein